MGNDATKTMRKKNISPAEKVLFTPRYACGPVGFMASITLKTHVLFEINEIKFQHSINTRLSQLIELKQARIRLQIFD